MITASLKHITLAGVVTAALMTSAAAQDVRIASHVSETSPLYATAQMFAEQIRREFQQRFTFKFYPNGELGKETALIDEVRVGSLEMAIVASGVLMLDDKLGVFDLPWLFTDRDHVKRAIKGRFGEEVKQRLEIQQGFIVLGLYEDGFRHVLNTKRAISKPEDMNGLKIGFTGSKYKRESFTAMGAEPVPIAWQETAAALQQGVVDGAEAALYGFYEAKLYETAKYLDLTAHTYSPSFLLVSKTFWDTLTEEQRATFRRVADEMFDDAYKAAADLEKGYLDKMKGGITISPVDPTPFQEKAKVVYESYVKENGAEWVEMVRAAR